MEGEGAAMEAVGGETQHLREQLFINLAPTRIDLIQGLRDQIRLWTGDDYWQVGGGLTHVRPVFTKHAEHRCLLFGRSPGLEVSFSVTPGL